jgi:hypothetical protein
LATRQTPYRNSDRHIPGVASEDKSSLRVYWLDRYGDIPPLEFALIQSDQQRQRTRWEFVKYA